MAGAVLTVLVLAQALAGLHHVEHAADDLSAPCATCVHLEHFDAAPPAAVAAESVIGPARRLSAASPPSFHAAGLETHRARAPPRI